MNKFDPRQNVANHYIKWLREGKPEMGWAGDQDLALVFAKIEQRWELWRHDPVRGHPDRHAMVAAGPPGAELNDDAINKLIRGLVDGDTHRTGNSADDIIERVLKHNEKTQEDQTQKAADATAETLARFYHEAGKAFGVTQTVFAV